MGSADRLPAMDLPSPFGEFRGNLSDSELRETAYEIFVGACRSSGGKPLTYIPQSERNERSSSPSLLSYASSASSASSSSTSPSLQRSVTSTAASKVKKALGLRSSKKSPAKDSSSSRSKKPVTVGELMRVQMRVSEQADSRIRRGLLRIAAGQEHTCKFSPRVNRKYIMISPKGKDPRGEKKGGVGEANSA